MSIPGFLCIEKLVITLTLMYKLQRKFKVTFCIVIGDVGYYFG